MKLDAIKSAKGDMMPSDCFSFKVGGAILPLIFADPAFASFKMFSTSLQMSATPLSRVAKLQL